MYCTVSVRYEYGRVSYGDFGNQNVYNNTQRWLVYVMILTLGPLRNAESIQKCLGLDWELQQCG